MSAGESSPSRAAQRRTRRRRLGSASRSDDHAVRHCRAGRAESKTAGATATFTFTGTGIAWIGTSAPNGGRAQVYLDGVLQATVDLHAASLTTRRIQFSKAVTSGSHTLQIKVYGTAGYVDVDAFVTVR